MASRVCNPSPSNPSLAIKGVAGMYDFYQDSAGQHPAAISAGKSVAALLPNPEAWVHENRAMVNRAVRLLARSGITQVVDLGSGKPSPHGNSTHEAVPRVAPEARVLYIEIEETAVVEGKKMIDGGGWGERVAMMQSDALDPAAIMESEEARRVIDWDKPVALTMSALVHFF
jgi:hypothetical protein